MKKPSDEIKDIYNSMLSDRQTVIDEFEKMGAKTEPLRNRLRYDALLQFLDERYKDSPEPCDLDKPPQIRMENAMPFTFGWNAALDAFWKEFTSTRIVFENHLEVEEFVKKLKR